MWEQFLAKCYYLIEYLISCLLNGIRCKFSEERSKQSCNSSEPSEPSRLWLLGRWIRAMGRAWGFSAATLSFVLRSFSLIPPPLALVNGNHRHLAAVPSEFDPAIRIYQQYLRPRFLFQQLWIGEGVTWCLEVRVKPLFQGKEPSEPLWQIIHLFKLMRLILPHLTWRKSNIFMRSSSRPTMTPSNNWTGLIVAFWWFVKGLFQKWQDLLDHIVAFIVCDASRGANDFQGPLPVFVHVFDEFVGRFLTTGYG